MKRVKFCFIVFLGLFFGIFNIFASQEQVLVEIKEFVNQKTIYNPLKIKSGLWADEAENQSSYNISGLIVVSNKNPNLRTVSDIFLSFDNTQNISLPVFFEGRNGVFIKNDSSSGNLILHIPQLRTGENSTFRYFVNVSNIRPPLNFSSKYSDTKVLAGDTLTVFDRIENVYDNFSYQNNTCIFDINITQRTVPVNFSGIMQDYFFIPSTTKGDDVANILYSLDNKTQFWNVLDGNCFNKSFFTNISYDVITPFNIPKTTNYNMLNATLEYSLNNSVSHLRLIDIKAISDAKLDFEKKIVKPAHPTLYGSNVTWNVTGYFNTDSEIVYNLTTVTFWVSQRNVDGKYTDLNTIDKDPISGEDLNVSLSPGSLINKTKSWISSSWLFNYSDIPSPIVWMDVNFTILNDGTQLINRSVTKNGEDIYIKELYLIIGYWLEINKNITSVGDNKYNIKIDVHNKGNQVTPADTVVTIYDFVPQNYNVSEGFVYSQSPWYDTAVSNNSISGDYSGYLFQWGLIPKNVLNTSFAQGPNFNENTTWSVSYNVTGFGDYELLDVFVTGLDPQKVDGAGSSKAVVVSEFFEKFDSTEGIFASLAGILLVISLLL